MNCSSDYRKNKMMNREIGKPKIFSNRISLNNVRPENIYFLSSTRIEYFCQFRHMNRLRALLLNKTSVSWLGMGHINNDCKPADLFGGGTAVVVGCDGGATAVGTVFSLSEIQP
jgi:hypothetical protein